MVRKSNKRSGVVNAGKLPTTPAIVGSIPRWHFDVIADRDENGNPSATEVAQFLALPGVPLAVAAIRRVLRDATSQRSVKPADGQLPNQPISA